MNHLLILIFGLSISIFIIMPAYSQSASLISVTTSELFYEEGDIIVISGNVTAVLEDHPVTLQIWHETTLIDVAQLEVAQDGSFSHTVSAEGPLWRLDGEYTVRATYGVGEIAESIFEYASKKGPPETTDIFEVDAGSHGTFDIEYNIRGGTLSDIMVDSDILGIIVSIEANSDGEITLNLPRDSIDAKKMNGEDDRYIILIDGMETPYEEISSESNSRKIIIEFAEGDKKIEIIGTFVIPEFGTIALLMLAITILSTIIISSKKNFLKL